MAQGTAKSALIYGALATALFITCEVCGTADTGASTAAFTPVPMDTQANPLKCGDSADSSRTQVEQDQKEQDDLWLGCADNEAR